MPPRIHRGRVLARVLAPLALVVALGLVAAGPTLAQEQFKPVRIGVGGVWPTGYVGALSRYGLPREVLIDYQLADPEVLSRFDLVIIAGVPLKIGASCRPAIEAVLAKGGSVFIDGSASGSPTVDWLGARFEGDPEALRGRPASIGFGGLAKRPMTLRLSGTNNPIGGSAGESGPIPRMYWGFLLTLTNPSAVEVLGQLTDASGTEPGLVLQKVGKGRVILCGGGMGVMSSHDSVNFDRLILGIVRYLTDGRAVPQFDPDGPRLARHQSLRSQSLYRQSRGATQAIGTAADRPAGPGTAGPLPKGFTAIEEEPGSEFNLSGQVDGDAEVLLNYWSGAHHVKVAFTSRGVQVARVSGGRATTLASGKPVPAGTKVTIKERAARLLVLAGDATLSAPLEGVFRGPVASSGKLSDLRCQPVEPVGFSDDFMRTSNESGGWETTGGAWSTAPLQNPNTSANPFSYRVTAPRAAAALYGYPFWDEYRASVSARADSKQGQIGLGVYAKDAANMILFRARVRPPLPPSTSGEAGGGEARLEDGFTLVRLADGKPEVLAQSAGGLVPGQWYRLQMAVRGSEVSVAVDNVKVLGAAVPGLTGGRLALWAEGAVARFDDVLGEPADTNAALPRQLVGSLTPTAGFLDLDTWAGSVVWEADAATPGLFWRRGCFFGSLDLDCDLGSLPVNAEATLILDGDGVSPNSGYSLVAIRDARGARVELRRRGRAVARAAKIPTEKLSLCLTRDGSRILGQVNGETVASTSYSPAGGGRLGYRAVGVPPRLSGLGVYTSNTREYTFNAAPAEWWVGSGQWDLINRWSCESRWSWYGCTFGTESAIWHKRALAGDTVMDVYLGSRSPDNKPWWEDKTGQFNVTLCGDGRSVESGYSFVVGDEDGCARLLRSGKVVAENKTFRWYAWGHNRWSNVRVEKHGGRLELFVEGQPILQYTDPQPLAEGYPAVWTRGNAIVIPYVLLYFDRLGQKVLSLE